MQSPSIVESAHPSIPMPLSAARSQEIALQTADESNVWIRVYVDLDVHEVTKRGVLEHEEPIEQHDRAPLHGKRLVHPGVGAHVVDRHVHLAAREQLLQMLAQEIAVE